jgi:flagellar protein FliJ
MPARFEFRLQPLLDARKRAEEEKQRNFASRRRALEENQEELDRLSRARRCEMKALRLRGEELSYLDDAQQAQRRRRAGLEAAYERAREELIAASRERRILEKLKERWRRAYDSENARQEALELDDANARRHERGVRNRLAAARLERAAP